MTIEMIGLIGAFFLLSAWSYETYETYKKGEKLNAKFVLIYLVGQIFLLLYSYLISSVTFMFLSGIILILTIVEAILVSKRKP